jgi:DNA-binding transcriptional regulator YiaG
MMVKAIQAADSKLPGVQLGLTCIKLEVPAAQVAIHLGVSRQTVYSWFTGRFKPKAEQVVKILNLHELYLE